MYKSLLNKKTCFYIESSMKKTQGLTWEANSLQTHINWATLWCMWEIPELHTLFSFCLGAKIHGNWHRNEIQAWASDSGAELPIVSLCCTAPCALQQAVVGSSTRCQLAGRRMALAGLPHLECDRGHGNGRKKRIGVCAKLGWELGDYCSVLQRGDINNCILHQLSPEILSLDLHKSRASICLYEMPLR